MPTGDTGKTACCAIGVRALAGEAGHRYLTYVLPVELAMATSAEKLTTVVSTKGQVILPKAIRDQLRWRAGTKLTVESTPDGVVLTATPVFPPTTMNDVFGSLRYDGPAKSIEEMDAAVAAAFKRRARG